MISRTAPLRLIGLAALLVLVVASGCDMGTYEQRYQQRAGELQNTPVQIPAP